MNTFQITHDFRTKKLECIPVERTGDSARNFNKLLDKSDGIRTSIILAAGHDRIDFRVISDVKADNMQSALRIFTEKVSLVDVFQRVRLDLKKQGINFFYILDRGLNSVESEKEQNEHEEPVLLNVS